MKKLFLLLSLAAPVLFSSCSKEETTVVPLDPYSNIEFNKRLAVTSADLIKYEIMQNVTNGNIQYMLFKRDVAAVLVANNTVSKYDYFTSWAVSGNTLTMHREDGAEFNFTISKEYTKVNNGYILTVYVKDNKGDEYPYVAVDDGSNSRAASQSWAIINNARAGR